MSRPRRTRRRRGLLALLNSYWLLMLIGSLIAVAGVLLFWGSMVLPFACLLFGGLGVVAAVVFGAIVWRARGGGQ